MAEDLKKKPQPPQGGGAADALGLTKTARPPVGVPGAPDQGGMGLDDPRYMRRRGMAWRDLFGIGGVDGLGT
jgi:hypothetical protein